jgi:hypothetical protein
MRAATLPFFLTNLAAAALVATSLVDAFNPATLVIQSFFIAISLWGLVSCIRGTWPSRDRVPDRLRPLR